MRMTPEEEEKLIQQEFQDLLNGYLASNHRKKVEIIERAFKFAKEAHKGVRRRSGEPYILHPIAVAKIASQEIGLGSTSICAALLHDVVEDTEYTVEDIEQHFGKKIAQIVNGLTKISGGKFGDRASAQAENFRKLLLTMSEDIRVVLLKMADRLHNMRTLSSMAPNKQYKIAGETLYIYAPLAHRLGLYAIKTELEDLSFKYEHPAAYERITQQIELRKPDAVPPTTTSPPRLSSASPHWASSSRPGHASKAYTPYGARWRLSTYRLRKYTISTLCVSSSTATSKPTRKIHAGAYTMH